MSLWCLCAKNCADPVDQLQFSIQTQERKRLLEALSAKLSNEHGSNSAALKHKWKFFGFIEKLRTWSLLVIRGVVCRFHHHLMHTGHLTQWYRSSYLTLCKKENQHISQNVRLFFFLFWTERGYLKKRTYFPSCLKCCLLVHIGRGDLCLLSTIMQLDGSQFVVFKGPKEKKQTRKQCLFTEIITHLCNITLRTCSEKFLKGSIFFLPNYTCRPYQRRTNKDSLCHRSAKEDDPLLYQEMHGHRESSSFLKLLTARNQVMIYEKRPF